MECCDDYGKCTRGFNCPVRESEEMLVVMLDEPPVSLDDCMSYFGAIEYFFIGVGFVALCFAVGMLFGG